MKKKLLNPVKGLLLLIIGLWLSISANGQLGVTAETLATKMTIGWNLGNSLEVPDGETAWGNPATTQTLIDAIKDAGFNTIRIPCAWDSYADDDTYEISSTWLARVKEVVDYCMNNDMYIIINIHWDGGWLEENPTYSMQESVNEKQEAYWTQIADYFIDYDEHLLFAGTNEVHYDYNTPTDEHIEVQESYNQTFVDAVRATGGNNSDRVLVVQTYNTNMWYGLEYFTLPTDNVSDRLMVECHYYDPYNFTLNSDNSSACTTWGSGSSDVCSWGQEDYVDDLFDRMKSEYIDNDIPVIIGEYGAIKRTSLSGTEYTEHIESRNYYLEYITAAAIENGMIPVYWDNGYNGDMGLALFDRSSGSVVDQDALDAIMEGAGVDTEETYSLSVSVSGSGSVSPSSGTYDAGESVTITATPDDGFEFTSWSGDLSSTDNPVTITMNSNYSITANFSEIGSEEYTLTTSVNGSGSVSPSSGTYDAGESVTITATPDDGYEFTSWSGDISSTDNPVTLTMNSDYSIIANFSEIGTEQYSLTTSVSGSGSISLSPSGGVYDAGDVVTVTATPDDGYQFDGWSGALSGSTNPTTITMNDNYSITATFSATSTGGDCDNPTSISLTFSKDGAGEYCWVTSDDISYINSWALESLTINDVDYTNVWSNSMPDKIDGYYYIYYYGLYAWSHFEATATKSANASEDLSNAVSVYPNPFSDNINLKLDNPETISRISILDGLGRNIITYDKADISELMQIGDELNSGIYYLQIYTIDGINSFSISKK